VRNTVTGSLKTEECMPDETDVIVIGSGGAGLTAALTAACQGAKTLVLEASNRWGGTTSISGGVLWVPCNQKMQGLHIHDSERDAVNYCRDVSPDSDEVVIRTYVRSATRMISFVERHSPLRFSAMKHPDLFCDAAGSREAGRHIEPKPVGIADYIEDDELGWQLPSAVRLSNDEFGALRSDRERMLDLARKRAAARECCMGMGIVTGLLQGCRDAGVKLARKSWAERLVHDKSGQVVGVETSQDGMHRVLGARLGVVLACGGFEHDAGLVARCIGRRDCVPLSPPVNYGSALRMSSGAGAELDHLGRAWFGPAVATSAGTWPDRSATPLWRMLFTERTMPHVIWINRAGSRFVNEASLNCCTAFDEVDVATNRRRNLPAWAIGDAQFRLRYSVAGANPGDVAPPCLTEAESLGELARKIGVDAHGLEGTVDRFNGMVGRGSDEDFGRGASVFDRAGGDPSAPLPNLGAIEIPPFFALEIRAGLLGTKGGPRVDSNARVLDWRGHPIRGLFAAGGAMASIVNSEMFASGITLGTAMTWGWLAGRSIVNT
jgi:3-oxosteroid 1-dehydrogenase